MEKNVFNDLPVEIRDQIDTLLEEGGKTVDGAKRERFAQAWKKKHDLFTGQISNIGMEIIERLETGDDRGMILLTYSGSLISLGTGPNGKRWLEYASIKFRDDVPDFVRGQGISLPSAVAQGTAATFDGSPLKQSSAIYRIAVCPSGTSVADQEQRIREATIYLTNGFIKINRTISGKTKAELDQFTAKSIINYVAKKNDITQTAARSIIDDYLSTVEAGALLGERVSLGKLASLTLKPQAAKKARVMKNIATGADILVPAKPASHMPKFTASKTLKEKSAMVMIPGEDAESGD